MFSVCVLDHLDQQEPYKPQWICTQAPKEQAPATNAPCSSTPSLPMKATKDALKLTVVSLPTSLQPLINHFSQKIITACCKQYAKEAIAQE